MTIQDTLLDSLNNIMAARARLETIEVWPAEFYLALDNLVAATALIKTGFAEAIKPLTPPEQTAKV